jgi:arsenite methyltransferase
MTEKADYGLDAPYVVRNLLLAGGACLLLWLANVLGFWSGRIGPVIFGHSLIWPAAGLIASGLGMIWSSKFGKVGERETLLDKLSWNGDEHVLDVGCGRGLLLIGAAKRLTTGRATGVDIWQTEDLSGNDPAATLENARREGVADRVAIETADMRKLPFPDASFDAVVSRAAIHNLYSAADRAAAIREIARVLKPGGRALIDDIRHPREYTSVFAQNGCPDVRRLDSRLMSMLWTLMTFGSLQPATLRARKAG